MSASTNTQKQTSALHEVLNWSAGRACPLEFHLASHPFRFATRHSQDAVAHGM